MDRDFLMKWLLGTAIFAVVLVLAAVVWLAGQPAAPPKAMNPHTPNLANGRTMFLIGGCASCHAVPEQDNPTRLGGGLALNSPFGVFYVPNISPDLDDGIGRWSEIDFVVAMRTGVSPEGKHLYPAFPYTSYHLMTSDDVRDLFAYLKTLPAIKGRVRDHNLSFPFNIRSLIGYWKLLFLDGKRFMPDPAQSAQWNRGAYLVNGPGHCAECHSPRNALGAIVARRRFTGGPSPNGQGGVPDITQGKLHDWKVEELAETLATGMTADADLVGGLMMEVVSNTRQLSPADREAIAVYIKSLSAPK
jgi:mono/diheme cytochrome c family protein